MLEINDYIVGCQCRYCRAMDEYLDDKKEEQDK